MGTGGTLQNASYQTLESVFAKLPSSTVAGAADQLGEVGDGVAAQATAVGQVTKGIEPWKSQGSTVFQNYSNSTAGYAHSIATNLGSQGSTTGPSVSGILNQVRTAMTSSYNFFTGYQSDWQDFQTQAAAAFNGAILSAWAKAVQGPASITQYTQQLTYNGAGYTARGTVTLTTNPATISVQLPVSVPPSDGARPQGVLTTTTGLVNPDQIVAANVDQYLVDLRRLLTGLGNEYASAAQAMPKAPTAPTFTAGTGTSASQAGGFAGSGGISSAGGAPTVSAAPGVGAVAGAGSTSVPGSGAGTTVPTTSTAAASGTGAGSGAAAGSGSTSGLGSGGTSATLPASTTGTTSGAAAPTSLAGAPTTSTAPGAGTGAGSGSTSGLGSGGTTATLPPFTGGTTTAGTTGGGGTVPVFPLGGGALPGGGAGGTAALPADDLSGGGVGGGGTAGLGSALTDSGSGSGSGSETTGTGDGVIGGSTALDDAAAGTTAARTTPGMPYMPMGAGMTGANDERRRSVWLDEEDDVWSAGTDPAPAVIGGEI